MRMRKKPNMPQRTEKCATVHVTDPAAHKGCWRGLMPGSQQLYLELGCGKGRFTAETAATVPDTLFVAIERVPEAMIIAMERAVQSDLMNVRFVETDAAKLCELFDTGEVSRIYINFCDPWPNNGHKKRRLTHENFLAVYKALLCPGGELHFKTDNRDLFEFSLGQFEKSGYTLREVTRDLHQMGPCGVMTDYESKFYSQGVAICRAVAVAPGEAQKHDN